MSEPNEVLSALLCDEGLREIGKPAVGRLVGTLVGSAIGCSHPGACSGSQRLFSVLATAGLGYAVGALWDQACDV